MCNQSEEAPAMKLNRYTQKAASDPSSQCVAQPGASETTDLEVLPSTRPKATERPTELDLVVLFERIIVSCTTLTGEIPPPNSKRPQI